MDNIPFFEVDELSHGLLISICSLEKVESHSNGRVVDVAIVNVYEFKAWCSFSRWSQGPRNIELIKVNTLKEMAHGLVVSHSNETARSIVSLVSEEERTVIKWLNCALGSIPVQKVVELPGLEIMSLGDRKPEGAVNFLMIDTINWVVHTLLIVSLENLEADQSIAMFVFGLEV